MKHVFRGWFTTTLLTVAMALAGAPAFAQGGASAPLSGVVADVSGGVIPGADVTVKNNATGETYTTVTNTDGAFTIPALVSGTYTVTAALMGFKTAVLSAVTIATGTPATVKITLEVGALTELVTVQSESSSLLQTQSPGITSTIDVNQIQNLPLTSRSALNFVINLAGVNTPGGSRDSTINGLPQGSINITIDGMSVQDNQLKTNDGFFARVSPRVDAVDEVTVSTAAQGSEATSTGAVQIRFITRSGTNTFTGRSYYYMRHYKLNANTWFNNRDGISKPLNILHQPGTRIGGPIVIPKLFDGRNRAFFFVNYEQERSPGELARNRTILSPAAQAGIFRYVAGGVTRDVNLFALAAANGHLATPDPTITSILGAIRAATGTTGQVIDQNDPLVQRYTYQVETKGLTKYPTTRVDVNITDKHRIYGSVNITDLLSTPDTLNNSEPTFPGFPGTGFQDSYRYATQLSLRSTMSANLVNEVRVGGTGGATKFSPNRTRTAWDDIGGFQYNLGVCCGTGVALTNARPGGTGPTFQAREASTKVIEDTLNWVKGSHNLQMGLNFVQGDVWIINSQHVPVINFGIDSNDPAGTMFNATNFPGSSTANQTAARNLYALLTGRITSINAEIRLDENTNQYVFLGPSTQRAQLRDYGLYIADTWRVKPNLTVSAGLRYVLQTPFYPKNDSYSTASIEDVYGVSGVGNIFKPGTLTGKTPEFRQFAKGERAYKTDRNNFAPNIGVAWTMPGAETGLIGRIFGGDGDSVLRGGFSIAYQRPGMSDFTGGIDDNPGLSQSANRNHSLNNLGTPGTIFLRNRDQLGAPAFPDRPIFPLRDVIDGDVHIFDQNLQVPWARTWSAGWQRTLGANMVGEIRYVGTRAGDQWEDYDFNEINIVENGFLDEFRLAQQNLQANLAAGRGANFRYFGPGTGTNPLPIFLAYFSGLGRDQAGNVANYNSALFANNTFVDPLARFNPQPFIAANALDAELARRNNAVRAGLPVNFLVVNPNLLGGAEITGNGGGTRHHSMQLELRKRLTHGLQFAGSYVYGRSPVQNFFSHRRPFEYTRDTGGEGEVTHAFKGTWVYDLPFGRGQKWGSNANGFVDRLIGGWSLDGIARIQTGRLIDFGNVRLIGMNLDDFRGMFKLRFDDAGRAVYMLPQDIIDNTRKAFSVNATSLTGYGDDGPPTGRYLAPANGPDCIEIGQSDPNRPHEAYGDCGSRELVVTGPPQIRFDMSIVKRVPIAGRTRAEFRAELLNAFNRPWFVPVGLPDSNTPYTTVDSFKLTGLAGETTARVAQLVFGLSW